MGCAVGLLNYHQSHLHLQLSSGGSTQCWWAISVTFAYWCLILVFVSQELRKDVKRLLQLKYKMLSYRRETALQGAL